MGFNGIDVNGNKEKPVIITAINSQNHMGLLGFLAMVKLLVILNFCNNHMVVNSG